MRVVTMMVGDRRRKVGNVCILSRSICCWLQLSVLVLCWMSPVSFGWMSPRPYSSSMIRRSLKSERDVTRLHSSEEDWNVVLRPSGEAGCFDEVRIGSCRVHRYSREEGEEGIDGEAEYVMWYHGRNSDIESNKKLPPLSTGRIGRAVSRNGLVWERCTEGSQSEEHEGVALGLNAESWWGFDTAHVGLGQVLLPMSTPAVMAEGGVYLMYYMGGSYEETPVGDYVTMDNAPEANLQGMNMRIGVAVSQDGETWGRVEGDDPTGAIIAPFRKDDPNMKQMVDMMDEDGTPLNLPEELYCAWPEVIYNDRPKNKQHNFYMFYSTMTKDDKLKQIAYAISEDGIRWFKKGLCLSPSSEHESGGVARCTVVKHALYDEDTNTWTDHPTIRWLMLYEGVNASDNKHRILAATSDDARNWNKLGVILDVNEDAWDSHAVGSPDLIRLDDGTTRLYYTGQNAKGQTAVGVAKSTQPDILSSFISQNESADTNEAIFAREQATFATI